VAMVYVPAGCFNMGSNDSNDNKQPMHEVCLDAFWIDQTEVTNGQYGSSGAFSGDQRPRESVTWTEAQAFCESRGHGCRRRPEWEYAARGPEGWTYPWGDEWDGNKVYGISAAARVRRTWGVNPMAHRWVGALDLSATCGSGWLIGTEPTRQGSR